MSLLLSAALLGSLAQPVSAAEFADAGGGTTYHVSNSTGGGSDIQGDGSVERPYLTISHAMEAAATSGVRDLTIALDSEIEITKTLAFDGMVPNITVQGNNYGITYRGDEPLGTGTAALTVSNGASVAFEDMALTRQTGLEYAGGILYVQNASAALSQVTVSKGDLSVSDVTDGGSAIHVAGGGHVLLADNTKITGNSTTGSNTSGAVYVAGGGELEITGAIIEENAAAFKGTGIYVQSGGTMCVYSGGNRIQVSDEIFIETGASASVGADAGMSGNITMDRVYLDSDATAAGGIAMLDISGETKDARIGVEMHDNYHYAYRLISRPTDGYEINNVMGEKDESGWSDLCGKWDVRYMVYDGVPGLYLYYHTINATFRDVDTLTGITGTDINGEAVSYYKPEDVQNSTINGGVLTVPELVPLGSGDYEINFTVDEANKDYRIPTPDQISVRLDGVTLINGTDYEYVPDYENGTASLKVFADTLKDAAGTLEFDISGEKYSLLTLKFNGPVYTMSTDITGQKVTHALSVVETVSKSGTDYEYEITRDQRPVEGISVVLYKEGTAEEAGTGVTGADGMARITGLDPAYSYYYVLYYQESFYVIARDKASLSLSTLEGQKMAERCESDESAVQAAYSVTDAENYSKATSVVTGTVKDTTVTYYVDLAQDNITFVANQGEATTADTATFHFGGEDTRADSISKHMETNAATYGSLPSMTMVGYDFIGWFTQAKGGEKIESGTLYDTVSSAKTLYAHWEPRSDIAYQVQHWVELADEGVNPGYVRDMTETRTENGKTYYLWSTDDYADGLADGTRPDVMDLSLKNMDVTDYSWWTLDGFTASSQLQCKTLADGSSVFSCFYDRNTYTMTYDPAEGVMKADGDTQTHKFGADVGPMLTAVRNGYVLGGWYQDLGADAEGVVTATSWYTWTGPVTVYAKWVISDTTYTLKLMTEDKSYNANGLACADGTYTQFKVVAKDNEGKPLSGQSDTELRVDIASINSLRFDGFTYVGYSLTPDETGASMTRDGESYTVAPNEFGTTVVYLYYARNKAEVSFMDDDGPEAGVHETVTVVYGDTFGPALPKENPAKPGYDFSGWVDGNGRPVDAGTDTNGYTAAGDAPLTLYPVWATRNYYITYIPGEYVTLDTSALGVGSAANSEVSGGYTVARSVTYDEPMGLMPTVSRPGYVFVGWMLEDGPGKGNYVTEDTIVDVSSVVMKNDGNTQEGTYPLRAMYEPYRYNLVLDPMGGTVDPAALTVAYDAPIPELPVPEKTGYTFTGWMLDTEDAGGTRIESGDTWTYLTANGAAVTAHAMYMPNRYRYELDLNDVDSGNGSTKASLYDMTISGAEIEFGSEYATVLDKIVAQRNGYTFLGWSMSRDKKDLIGKDRINRLAEGSTLYAIWQPMVYELHIGLNGGTLPQENWFNFNSYAAANYQSYADTYGGKALKATFDAQTGTWTVPVIFDTVYGEIGELARENYKFEGYRVSAPGWYNGDTPVLNGEIVKDMIRYTDFVDGAVALDAVWTPYFDFVLDGGASAFADGETGYKHILKTGLDALPVAVRDGWAFLGWYDDVSKQYVDLTFILTLDEYRSFRAVFTPEITFDGNGGQVIVDGTGHGSYTIGLSALVERYGRFFDARSEGRTFLGWVSSDTSDLTVFENIVNRSAPMTLTASWGVGITFQLPSGAYWPDGSKGDRTYSALEVGEMTELPPACLDGYTFVEWQDADGRTVTPAGLSAMETSITVHPLFKAESGQRISVKVTNYAPSTANWQAPAADWIAGTNTFTVTSDMACAVALVRDGSLTVLECAAHNGTYAFTANLRDHDEIVIVLVGDSDLDGRLTAADLVCLSRHFGGEYDLPACAALAADTDLDDKLTAADLVSLSRYFGGEYTPRWRLAG